MPTPNPHAHIFVDLVSAFARNCQRELDDGARGALYGFIEVTVIAALENSIITDYAAHRDYLVRHFGRIGRTVESRSNAGAATRDEVMDVCTAAVDAAQERLKSRREESPERITEQDGKICESFRRSHIDAAPSARFGPVAGPR